jgi:hypothetical protein
MDCNACFTYTSSSSRSSTVAVLWLVAATLLMSPTALAAAEGTPCNPEPTDMVIAYGDLITCSIEPTPDLADIFRFQGQQGELVSIVASRRGGGVLRWTPKPGQF